MLNPSALSKLLSYDPDTGILTWKPRDATLFSGPRKSTMQKTWNARFSGREALTAIHSCGYKHGRIFNKLAYAHRVAWSIFHEEVPEHEIDHINGIATDNRISNLRHVPHDVNLRNCRLSKNNTSGFNGVSFDKRTALWVGEFSVLDKKVCVYGYKTPEKASVALEVLRRKFDFGPMHGVPTGA